MDNLKMQGVSMPKLGLGTFRMQGDACRAAVESALSIGYRHIDTAEMYANEEAIGAALATAGVPRGELHVTTKVWHENLAPDAIANFMDQGAHGRRADDAVFHKEDALSREHLGQRRVLEPGLGGTVGRALDERPADVTIAHQPFHRRQAQALD